MSRMVTYLIFALVLVAAGLGLGLLFAPRVLEASCHWSTPAPQLRDTPFFAPGSPNNPVECRERFGRVECSSRY